MMFLLGFAAGAGFYICALGSVELLAKRSDFVIRLRAKLSTHDFAFQFNVSLIVSITSSLLVGLWLKEFVVLATVLGFALGWLMTGSHLAKRRREDVLHLAIATATLAEDCAILSTTHLSLRQSLTLAINAGTEELQRRAREILDFSSEHVLLVHQLQNLAQSERDNSLGRFARTLALALERGNSPESSLLQLAREIRETARRELLQLAAKKEIAMMVPVVFAVLPSVTAVALFPAMKSLQQL